MQAWSGDNLLRFDGDVLEVFGHPATPSARYHVLNLELELGEPDRRGRRTLFLASASRHSGRMGLVVEPEDGPQVEPLVDAVLAAMDAAQSGPPGTTPP